MGKGYRNKICVYCGGVSSTADHVFARELIPIEFRGDLPKVPSCSPCNGKKSDLEHYLATILPFGGNHPANPTMLSTDGRRRLGKNRKLHRELADGAVAVRWIENDVEHSSTALPINTDRLLSYITFVTRGLAAYHWNTIIPRSHTVCAGLAMPEKEQILMSLFLSDGSGYASGRIGNDLIMYEGKQGKNEPYLTIWRFLIYQGMKFGAEGGKVLPYSHDIWAVTSTLAVPGFFVAD